MYEEVVRLKKPFFEWQLWIEERIRQSMLRDKYGFKKSNLMELLETARKDAVVTVIDPGYKLIDKFF